MSKKMGFFVLKTGDADQQKTSLLPVLDVAACVITCQGKILTGFNAKWGAFTLPTTKRRSWEDENAAKGSVREEEWEDAATRAAAEWLGQTITVEPEFLTEVPEFQQSDRDGSWKRYHLRAFELERESQPDAVPGRVTEWLTADQIIDKERKPISPTARHIIAELQLKGLV